MKQSNSDQSRVRDGVGARVVILEEEPARLRLLTGILRDAGYRVSSGSVEAGLFREDADPELVILGAVTDSRASAGRPISPSIPLLGLYDASSQGADAYLPAPFSSEELLDAVGLLLCLTGQGVLVPREALVDVGAVLEVALQRAAGALSARSQVTREFDSQLRVFACPEQLCLIFLNLLLTAASRMDAGSRSANGIRVAGWRTANGRTVVEISDSGHPIPTNQLAHLFDESADVEMAARCGLSLPASQRAMNERGGAITVKSKAGGSSFRVELPTAER